MFVDAALAARIDRVEARLSAAVAGAIAATDPGARSIVIPIGGAVAALARPGSPVNKLIGAGFALPIDPDALDVVEAAWTERGEPVRVELATLACPEAACALPARGYGLRGFENVLVRPLADVPVAPAHVGVTADADADAARWMQILVDGFAAGDGTGAQVDDYGREAIEAVMRDFAAAPGFSRYVARLDGVPVGAATLRIDDGIALMCGAATLPAARRRGVQAALFATRLADARQAGCELAVVTTAPGSMSQHNAMRTGFALAYARAILIRDA